MITCGGGNDAARALIWPHLGDEVDSSAHFKGTHWLIVLVFNIRGRTQKLIERGIAVKRCTRQVWPDLFLCEQDILKGWCLHMAILFTMGLSTIIGRRAAASDAIGHLEDVAKFVC